MVARAFIVEREPVRAEKWAGTLLQVLLGTMLLALSAQVVIPLPFTPVPIALHPSVAILLGMTLGSRKGALCLLAYLLEGCMGLPVFMGGHSGFAWLLGPTGGYLVGFLIAAFAAGWIRERKWGGETLSIALAYVVANSLIFICGATHLASFVGWDRVFVCGVLPFIPGDVLKAIFLLTALSKTSWGFLRR